MGHQTCKNRRPYNLYRVGADVKTMLNQSFTYLKNIFHFVLSLNYCTLSVSDSVNGQTLTQL